MGAHGDLWHSHTVPNVFFRPKDLLHTTQRQNALLSEQEQLQKDISKWIARFESCQKETETKEQQLQELQNEIRESKLQLEQQEMVLHKGGHFVLHGSLCLSPPHPRSNDPRASSGWLFA